MMLSGTPSSHISTYSMDASVTPGYATLRARTSGSTVRRR